MDFFRKTNEALIKHLKDDRGDREFTIGALIIGSLILIIASAFYIGAHFESLALGVVVAVLTAWTAFYLIMGLYARLTED